MRGNINTRLTTLTKVMEKTMKAVKELVAAWELTDGTWNLTLTKQIISFRTQIIWSQMLMT